MRSAMHDPHGTQGSGVTRLRRLAVIAALLGAFAIPVGGGSVAGQGPAGGLPNARTWSAWLQRHLEQEYRADPTPLVVPGTIAWARHLELEYPS